MSQMYYSYLESPVGSLLLAGNGEVLQVLGFPAGRTAKNPEPDWLKRNEVFKTEKAQLRAYFAGELTQFTLAVAPKGTEFQQQVWKALLEIPYGETRSYGDIALRIGQPTASRAVGAANGLNPLPIIIPCHRVIGSNGRMVGFGGGLPTKEYLLALEQSSMPFSLS